MKVLHVSTRREWRGGEQQLWWLARATKSPVVCPPDSALAARLGVEVRAVPFRGAWWGGAGLRAVVEAERPDLLAVHDANGLRAALSCGVPVVAHRRLDFVPSRFGVARLRRCAGVIAVSVAVSRVLHRVGVERVHVVRDGVVAPPGAMDRAGVRAELGLGPEAPLVVAVGALVPHKGHATLVQAAADLPGVHVAILGEGPLRAMLTEAARGSRVHLLGHRQDVGRWLRSADLVVHPSRDEGLGQVVSEALAVGARVVVSDAGGLVEHVGVVGRFPAGDPVALAAAARRAFAEPPPRARVPSPGEMVAATLAAYASLVGVPPTRIERATC